MLKLIVSRSTAIVVSLAVIAAAYAASISHDRLYSVNSGQRIDIVATIEDTSAIDVARVYFKARAGANFNFVKMTQESGKYVATLPAPSKGAGQIEYAILAKSSGVAQPFRSPTYQVLVNDTDNRVSAEEQELSVYSELEAAPESIEGFTDNLAVDIVESGARYAAAAGIGEAGGSAVASAADAAAEAAATTSSSSGGMSGGAIAGIVAGGAVAVGAVAYGASELSDSSDDYFGGGGCTGDAFGYEAVSSSGGFTARAAWFIDTDGTMVFGQWDSDGISNSCTVQGDAGTIPCSDIEAQLQDQCDAYTTSGVTCGVIQSRPFYLTCG